MSKNYKQQRDNAKLKLEAKVFELKLKKLNSIQQKYDATKPNAGAKRRTPQIENQSEEKILRNYDRLKMLNLTRDLERNTTSFKSLQKQLKQNTAGDLAKIQVNISDKETASKIEFYFNSIWAKNCDFYDDTHFSDLLKLVIATVVREGDVLLVFDNFLLDTGKILFYEADQLVTVNKGDWEQLKDERFLEKKIVNGKEKLAPMNQADGVITDSYGRVMGYVVTSQRGLTTQTLDKCTLLTTQQAKLIKSRFRFNQKRGIGDAFALVADIEDIYEMRSKELQSAKVASSFAGIIKKEGAEEDALMRGGIVPDDIYDDTTTDTADQKTNYEQLETLTGGFLEYMEPEDDFKGIDFNRPNPDVAKFFDFVLTSSGSSLGLAQCYTNLKVSTSYTAFRGEMILTWATFYEWQKFLERYVCDWLAEKVINWAVSKGKLKVNLPDNWQYSLSWVFPKMPSVDEVKEGNAKANGLKNGLISFSDIHGANWREKLDNIATGLDYAKEKNIPLDAFETKSGAVIEENNNTNSDNNGDDNE